jgi:hypothetical protein
MGYADEFLGVVESPRFSRAIEKDKRDVWGIGYDPTKKGFAVKRVAKNITSLYMFSLDRYAVEAVWNNLRFELLFVGNDSDERYSIQTHEALVRNLLVEGCEEPYGYAEYYSEEILNL